MGVPRDTSSFLDYFDSKILLFIRVTLLFLPHPRPWLSWKTEILDTLKVWRLDNNDRKNSSFPFFFLSQTCEQTLCWKCVFVFSLQPSVNSVLMAWHLLARAKSRPRHFTLFLWTTVSPVPYLNMFSGILRMPPKVTLSSVSKSEKQGTVPPLGGGCFSLKMIRYCSQY